MVDIELTAPKPSVTRKRSENAHLDDVPVDNGSATLLVPRKLRARRGVRTVLIVVLSIAVGAGVGVGGWMLLQSQLGGSAATSQSPAVDSLLQSGIDQANAGQVDAAKVTFQNVLALDPGNVLANYNLGVIAQGRSDNQGALSYYVAALASNPNFTPAMYNRAIILEATDQQGAIELYKRIVAINPKAATAYFRLANLYEAAGETELATEARNQAISLDPSLGGN
ncbi:MAG TPA: tetratricopeptide repeat protein [Microbacteriaceae bacterium]|nr:tetratricopeptide repeat protein [Microbacteriaceae bacterium]